MANVFAAVWLIGGREFLSSRDGSVTGARAFARSMGVENYDWAILINSRDYESEEQWSDLIYEKIPDVWAANKIVEA